jgi:dienelactone hydrolase
MELKQNASACVILLHEIYGVNEHIKHYAQLLFKRGFDVYVPNMIQRNEPFTYEEADKAYENFINNVGFIRAQAQIQKLIHQLSNKYEEIQLIGFSVGATIAWLCSESAKVHKVVAFYGSRIRQYTNVQPKAKTILVFGNNEKSFNPIDLKESLRAKENMEVHIVEGAHGFADPYSSNYNRSVTEHIIENILFDLI